MRPAAITLLAVVLALGRASASDIPVIHGAGGLRHLVGELGKDPGGHSRPVVLHFFAMWCAECVADMPAIRQAGLDARAAGAAVVFLSLDDPAQAGKLPPFLTKHAIPFPVYVLDAPDPQPIAEMIDASWRGGLPATFVLRGGKRAASFKGPMRDGSVLVRAVLAGKHD